MTEPGLPTDNSRKPSLEETKAFRENSAEVFIRAIDAVVRLAEIGDIFPPDNLPFPRPKNPSLLDPVTINLSAWPRELISQSPWGSISQVEAVAFYVLTQELAAYAAAYYSKSPDVLQALEEVICSRPDLLPYEISEPFDVINGFTQFLLRMSQATWTRHRLMEGQPAPEDPNLPKGFITPETHSYEGWKWFSNALQQDNLTLGENTAQAVFDVVKNEAERHFHGHVSRVNSYTHGGDLAKRLYIETYRLAATLLSTGVALRPSSGK